MDVSCRHEDGSQYDMIVGTDLMNELGIDISFSNQKITWAGATLPMCPRRILTSRKQLKYFYEMTMEATVLKEVEQWQNKILDANYEATDVNALCRDMSHLKPIEQQKLAELLNKYPRLFKGGLGTLNVPPVKIEIRPLTQSENRTMREPFRSHTATKRQHAKRWNNLKRSEYSSVQMTVAEWAAPTFVLENRRCSHPHWFSWAQQGHETETISTTKNIRPSTKTPRV